jgi:UDP-GlcNAc:undecaprenyl-phosphate GlcNAc-1-phosphate transferase
MTWILLLSGASAFAVTALALPLVMRLARRGGFLDHPDPRKTHTVPMPYGGGIAVALGFLVSMAGGLGAAWAIGRGVSFGLPPDVTHHASGAMSKAPELGTLMCGSLVILFLGAVDDRRKLGPGTKLLVETLVAAGFVLGGERLSLFWEGSLPGDLVGGAVTVLWIVGITNAFNLIDHMDGMAGGVALLACAAFGIVAWVTGQWFVASAIAALGGSCAAFLRVNFPPARMFLGDAGALFIGFVLAALTVTFTFYEKNGGMVPAAWAIPLVILAIPLYDTASVVLTRLRTRRPIFEGDRNHLAHRLLDLGMSPRAAVLTVYSMTAMTGLAAVLLLQVDGLGAALILAQLAVTFTIISLIDQAGRKRVAGSR